LDGKRTARNCANYPSATHLHTLIFFKIFLIIRKKSGKKVEGGVKYLVPKRVMHVEEVDRFPTATAVLAKLKFAHASMLLDVSPVIFLTNKKRNNKSGYLLHA
jgi:hypothetical protein